MLLRAANALPYNKSMTRSYLLSGAALVFSLVAGMVAYSLADSYIDRLPNHEGLYLVAVDSEVHSRPATLPGKTVFVLVDGLREDSARAMHSATKLAEHGHCRTTSTGGLTISRPVYALMSTGLEADRTGSRNNDDTSPVAAQSIWQVAHEAGLRVHVISELPWWRQLFPLAFDDYVIEPDDSVNYFERANLGDLTIIHPVRVDTAGHDYGAASPEYREAVRLVDEELSAFLDTLDLAKDFVIFTADHGHSETGGHGGTSPEISEVLTCFAGPGIESEGPAHTMDARILAPILAARLGLAFPRHMRATDDQLDEIFSVLSAESLGAAYLSERKAEIERFRVANREQIGRWLGEQEGSWSALYQRERRKQSLSWLLLASLLIVVTIYSLRRRELSSKQSVFAVLWIAGVIALSCLAYTLVRGSFDFTSINRRQEFLDASLAVGLVVGGLGIVVHAVAWRNGRALLCNQLTMVALLFVIDLAHPLIYGDPLGFPLPGPTMLFLPFLFGALTITASLLCASLAIITPALRWLSRRRHGYRRQ